MEDFDASLTAGNVKAAMKDALEHLLESLKKPDA